ncbi:MAG TPA: hypothetical protein DCY20_09630, partial [Firmicutes bacterium]|nr:hypothetical protein [Bacillota bacterium]
PKKISTWIEHFVFNFSSKPLQAIVEKIAADLIENEYVTTESYVGLLGQNKTKYHANFDLLRPIYEAIRDELLGSTPLSSNTIILYSLLERGGMSSQYFSKQERKVLRGKFKQLKDREEYQFAKQYIDEVEAILLLIVMPK